MRRNRRPSPFRRHAADNGLMCGKTMRPHGRGWRGAAVACLLLIGGGCRNLEVITESYSTLPEARAAGAVDRRRLPRGLPEGTRDLRVAHDLDSSRRWGLFNFPQAEGGALKVLL